MQKKGPRSLKPQQSRKLIRRFHTLNKGRSAILETLGVSQDVAKAKLSYKDGFSSFVLNKKSLNLMISTTGTEDELLRVLGQIDAETEQRGGINAYQVASTQGQTGVRGGDSLKKLVQWLRESYRDWCTPGLNALEIGCLHPENHISTCRIFSSITRIDLNSQHPMIMKQDFMERPLPKTQDDKFDMILCSLVVNFVPSPKDRGAMLQRLAVFMKQNGLLFFVLPLPCTENSRYCTKDLFLEIMTSLGFTLEQYHASVKLSYWLFRWNSDRKKKTFAKKELKKGGKLNNFCVVVE